MLPSQCFMRAAVGNTGGWYESHWVQALSISLEAVGFPVSSGNCTFANPGAGQTGNLGRWTLQFLDIEQLSNSQSLALLWMYFLGFRLLVRCLEGCRPLMLCRRSSCANSRNKQQCGLCSYKFEMLMMCISRKLKTIEPLESLASVSLPMIPELR